MKVFLILASFGILVSGGSVQRARSERRPYRDTSYSGSEVDLRALLNAVEGNSLQQYGAPNAAPQQQYGAPAGPSYSPAPQQQYGAPAFQQQQQFIAAPPLQQVFAALPVQQYGAPQVQQVYGAPAATRYIQVLSAGVSPRQIEPLSITPALRYGAPAGSASPGVSYGAPLPSQQLLSAVANAGSGPSSSYGPPQNSVGPGPSSNYGPPPPQPPNFSNSGSSGGYPSAQQNSGGYGAPAQQSFNNAGPSGSYGAPGGGQSFGQQSFNSGGGNFGGGPSGGGPLGLPGDDGGDGGDGFSVTRDVSVHIPPADSEAPPPRPFRPQPPRPKKRQKNYKIIFIRAPTPPPPEEPIIPEIPEQPETKTLVYVLVKKPEAPAPIVIPTPEPPVNSQPEVYFIKYRHPSDGGGPGDGGDLGGGGPGDGGDGLGQGGPGSGGPGGPGGQAQGGY